MEKQTRSILAIAYLSRSEIIIMHKGDHNEQDFNLS